MRGRRLPPGALEWSACIRSQLHGWIIARRASSPWRLYSRALCWRAHPLLRVLPAARGGVRETVPLLAHLLPQLRHRHGELLPVSASPACTARRCLRFVALWRLYPSFLGRVHARSPHPHPPMCVCPTRCQAAIGRVERIAKENGLFISPLTLQSFKSRCMRIMHACAWVGVWVGGAAHTCARPGPHESAQAMGCSSW